jgi:hypothetical protein
VALEPRTLSRLEKELDSEPRTVIAGARIVPLPEKGPFSLHRRALAKILGNLTFDNRVPWLIGTCYAIRRQNAVGVKLPEDQRIHEDTYLELLFDRQVKIVPGAKVFFKLGNYADHLRQRARAMVSTQLLREQYPKLFQTLLRRRNLRNISKRRLLQGLSLGEKAGFGLNQIGEWIAAKRARSLLKSRKDTWPKTKSTKRLN